MDVFESNPDTAHESRRLTVKMRRITLQMLLGPYREIQCLKGKRLTSPARLQHRFDFRQ